MMYGVYNVKFTDVSAHYCSYKEFLKQTGRNTLSQYVPVIENDLILRMSTK